MKNLKFLFVLLISVSILTTSCKKDDDPDDIPDVPVVTFKGAASVTIDGTTYSDLVLDVVENTDLNEGTQDVGCYLRGGYSQGNPEIEGNNFALVIANIPAVGETATFTENPEEFDTQIIILGSPVEGHTRFMAVSGTVTRESADKYTLNASLTDIPGFAGDFSITGTIEVGTHIEF
ncbi:MAG: hypothetical protein GQ527_03720 [Bacteroidales bacterium]|nr:hypothetical protein [Bacteroidales bacterium]